MKKLGGPLICLLALLVLQVATPFWWWILVVPLAYGATLGRSGWDAFRSGMIGAGVLWLVAGAILASTSGRLVAERVAGMLQVGSPWTVLLATATVAMLAGGIAGGAGHFLRDALRRPAPRS